MITIIGIGDDGTDGLPSKTVEIIKSAKFIAGGERQLSFFPDQNSEKFVIKSNLKELISQIEKNEESNRDSIILASGDPLFHGIGGFLLKKFPHDSIKVVPYVSSMQLAFAAAKLSWNDATFVSVHGKPLDNLVEPVKNANTLGIFTSDGEQPGKIAEFLADMNINGFDAIICERVGSKEEKVFRMPLSELKEKCFDPLNILILTRKENS